MNSNQKDNSPLRQTEADQKLKTPNEPVEADSQASEEAPDAQPQTGERPDLDWTDHED
jgi:hypothetical protein